MIRKILFFVFAALAVFLSYLTFFKNDRADSSAERITSSSQIPEKYLSGNELELYRALIGELRKTAEGERSDCAYFLNVSEPFADIDEYRQALKKVNWFTRNYAPEYNFWTDGYDSFVHSETECTVIYYPSPKYIESEDYWLISSERLAAAKDAMALAERIAKKYESKNDHEKVIGYAAEICALNTYNREAADDDDYSDEDIDPWRIVSVFDGDPRTNVVCGGYAQAFQYLCGLGGIECHYVKGDIEEGYHAWNIVVIDGVSYYVDVTFCDSTGYSADEIKKRHPFVMNGVTKSSAEGIEVNLITENGRYWNDYYSYDEKTRQYLPEELLAVSEKNVRIRRKPYLFLAASLIGAVICAVPFRKRSQKDEDNCNYQYTMEK